MNVERLGGTERFEQLYPEDELIARARLFASLAKV